MSAAPRVVRVAAVQAAPAFLDGAATLPEKANDPDGFLYRGGSCIIAPNARLIAGPVLDEETVVVADCDLDEIVRESLTLDVSGHYSRPDLFELRFRPRAARD